MRAQGGRREKIKGEIKVLFSHVCNFLTNETNRECNCEEISTELIAITTELTLSC